MPRKKAHCGDRNEGCTKTMSWKQVPWQSDDELERITLWRIRYWCNLSMYAGTKKDHIKAHPEQRDLPPEDAILRGMLPRGL